MGICPVWSLRAWDCLPNPVPAATAAGLACRVGLEWNSSITAMTGERRIGTGGTS